MPDANRDDPVRPGPPFLSLGIFAAATGLSLVLGKALSWASVSVGLDALRGGNLDLKANCAIGTGIDALHLYTAQSRWSATFVFLLLGCVAAAIAAAMTVRSIWREDEGAEARWTRARRDIVALGVVAVIAIAGKLVFTPAPVLDCKDPPELSWPGFLSYLLTTFRESTACNQIVSRIWWSKRIAETAGLFVAAAMAATAAPVSTVSHLADRVAATRRLLYAGSLLFVIGMLITQANCAWIAATWTATLTDEKAAKEIAELISACTMQAGVGYSATLVAFYLPARAYLAWQIDRRPVGPRVEHPKGRRKDDEEQGLAPSWGDEIKQILALLAPILSAPVLDALVKK